MNDKRRRAEDDHRLGADIAEVERRFAVRLTDTVKQTIKNVNDPVARQYLPDLRELEETPQERNDPIGDHAHSPVKGIVHRHKDRVLFKVSSVCAVNCRFCFRKTMLGTPEETLHKTETDAAVAYIADHPEIREVILTGGDPLILSAARLQGLLDRLEAIAHIELLGIHSRIPVADPARIDDAVLTALKRDKPVYLVLHINHEQEISPAAEAVIKALHQNGITLLSQSVLLKGVNDNTEALEQLFRALLKLRVKPYYLHHPDMVPGTGHFRIDIKQGQALMQELRRRMTGLGLPTYVLDIPGGYGKTPLESAYAQKTGTGYAITDHEGVKHIYQD